MKREEYEMYHDCDFNNGAQVTMGEIESWHKETLAALKKDGAQYAARSSGNGIVFGWRYQDGDIKIYEVSNGFHEYNYRLNQGENQERSIASVDGQGTKADTQPRLENELEETNETIKILEEHDKAACKVYEETLSQLSIAQKALEKILQAQAIDGYIPTFKLPYSARIANDALSKINKGEPGK